MLGKKVASMFKFSKQLYGQSLKTFYVSTEDYEGLHIGILPPYVSKKFSEYTMGSIEDVAKIITKFKKENELKSLYCSMCTIMEPDNYYELNQNGN